MLYIYSKQVNIYNIELHMYVDMISSWIFDFLNVMFADHPVSQGEMARGATISYPGGGQILFHNTF